MNDSDFDPYHKWLSIPRSEQPANYYRLLGVPFFESDPDVIESAAQRQITHVRSFALGQHAELSQSILNELAKARATLLDPAAKVKYDTWLNAQQRQPAVAPSPPNAVDDLMQSVPFDISTVPVAPRKTSRPKNRRKQRSKLIPLIAGIAVALLVIAMIGWLLSDPKQPVVAELPVSKQPSRDIQVVEDQDGIQPSQPQSRLGSRLDSAKPSVGGTAEAMNEEAGDATELGVESETTLPPEPEEERTETVVVSSEQSDANNTPPAAVAPFDSDQAKSYQEAWAEHLGERVEVTNSIGMKLRVIPPGTFMMGEGNDAHEVTLTKPYLLGMHEVTQADYQTVMGANPSKFKGLRSPVEMVTWEDANEFCQRLSLFPREKRAGRVYRLPTEAEWEFAFRAGTTTTYSFGDNDSLLSRYAWYRANGGGTTHPVGSKLANPFGLHDMHGNIWEWCNDWFGRYSTVSVTDPKGPQSGVSRVLRGGSFGDYAVECRSASRARDLANPSNYGFRVACILSSE
ncbi:MAG: SUMF1/EgtB/PvdO family nonheme iron enzyme [Rubripirellula sp.]